MLTTKEQYRLLTLPLKPKCIQISLKRFRISLPEFPRPEILSGIVDDIMKSLDILDDVQLIILRSGIEQEFYPRTEIHGFRLDDLNDRSLTGRQEDHQNYDYERKYFLHCLLFLFCQFTARSASFLAASISASMSSCSSAST